MPVGTHHRLTQCNSAIFMTKVESGGRIILHCHRNSDVTSLSACSVSDTKPSLKKSNLLRVPLVNLQETTIKEIDRDPELQTGL